MEEQIEFVIGKADKKDVLIDAQEFVTGRTCVIGQSGSGKSYLIAVLCEKLLENNIAFCIVDTEGEYFSLKQKFEVLWAGGSQADINLEEVDLADLIEKSIKNNVPLILDVSDSMDQRKLVGEFSSKLYEIGTELREPYLLIVEEADKFVGQNKDSLKEIEEISKRGRKRGIGLLVATQRPSLVNKNVLSQCGNQFIGKLATENDLKAVDLFFTDRKELEFLPKLVQGEFFVSGGVIKQKEKMRTVERITQHKGLTPKLVKKSSGKISEIKTGLGSTEKVNDRQENILNGKSPEKEIAFGRKSLSGVKLEITKERLDQILEDKKKKKYGLFGEKEKLVSANLIYHPLLWVQISAKDGIIRKEFKNFSFILDGVTGDFADVDNGLKTYSGISQFVGLDENQIRVLMEIEKAKKATTAELELKTQMSEVTVRKVVSSLQDKKLLTFSLNGRSKIYSPLTNLDIPNLKQNIERPEAEPFSNKSQNPVLTEDSVRKIVKAVKEGADITKYEVFYYPVWQISFDGRKILIDGVTGREI